MISDKFPRYRQYDPIVPVWCVTSEIRGCIHRFFDTSPISPSGRYLAVFQLPFENRRPQPGEAGAVWVVDLWDGKSRLVAGSRGWEPQLGANINWGATDRELFFNDVDIQSWQPFAWKCDFVSGKKERLEGTVYHASPNGRLLISANMTTMGRTQPGYGVCIPFERVRRNIGPPTDDGFYLTDAVTGKTKLFASLADLLTLSDPPVRAENPSNFEFYGFHSKFNAAGDRLMLSMRWFPVRDGPCWDMFGLDFPSVRYAWVTTRVDGSEKACAIGPEQWEKGGHHAAWFPDGERISMNLNIDHNGMRFVEAKWDGSGLRKMLEKILGSGHPTVHRDSRHLLTDAYSTEPVAFGDGTIPLRWLDLDTGSETVVARINTATPYRDPALRVDAHPAWDRSWRYVTFNAFVGGTRRVFVADMACLLQGGGTCAS